MSNTKRALVTGADGFVGRALVKALSLQGVNVVAFGQDSGDIVEPETLDKLQDKQIDHVFHLAGKTYVPASWESPMEYERVNVCGTINVLEFCRKAVASLTYVSAYVYGEPPALPVSESTAVRPNNPYAMSKLQAEQWCSFYAEHYGVASTVIRPFNIFGPGQREDFLIPFVIQQVREGKKIVIKDDAPKRDYCYIDDLVRALLLAMSQSWEFEVINIGSGESLSVGEIVSIIQSVAGTDLPVTVLGEQRRNEIDDVRADITKAKRLLGWVPKWSFREGIEKIWGNEK